MVSDRDNFVWKGHDPLTAVASVLEAKQPAGLQLTSVVQLYPPAAISAVACSPGLGLLALGTAHGLALVDYLCARPVLTKCTLNPNGTYVAFFVHGVPHPVKLDPVALLPAIRWPHSILNWRSCVSRETTENTEA